MQPCNNKPNEKAWALWGVLIRCIVDLTVLTDRGLNVKRVTDYGREANELGKGKEFITHLSICGGPPNTTVARSPRCTWKIESMNKNIIGKNNQHFQIWKPIDPSRTMAVLGTPAKWYEIGCCKSGDCVKLRTSYFCFWDWTRFCTVGDIYLLYTSH